MICLVWHDRRYLLFSKKLQAPPPTEEPAQKLWEGGEHPGQILQRWGGVLHGHHEQGLLVHVHTKPHREVFAWQRTYALYCTQEYIKRVLTNDRLSNFFSNTILYLHYIKVNWNFLLRYVIGKEYHDCDQTIEILMNDLDPEIMNIFYKCNTDSASLATKVCKMRVICYHCNSF